MNKKQEIIKQLIDNQIVNVELKYIDYFGNTKSGILEVNKLIADQTYLVFDELYNRGFPINKISEANGRSDEEIIMVNDTTAYNFRTVMGKDILSKHAFGLAIDINPKNNPAKPSKMKHVYDEAILDGKLTDDIINVFKDNGFNWGGEIFGNFWDSHHFEIDMNNKNRILNKIF